MTEKLKGENDCRQVFQVWCVVDIKESMAAWNFNQLLPVFINRGEDPGSCRGAVSVNKCLEITGFIPDFSTVPWDNTIPPRLFYIQIYPAPSTGECSGFLPTLSQNVFTKEKVRGKIKILVFSPSAQYICSPCYGIKANPKVCKSWNVHAMNT